MALKPVRKVGLTGDRPTGKLHLGHYSGSLSVRLKMQDDDCDLFVMVADVQALTDNFESPGVVRDNVCELVADYIAIGIDPERCTIFVQSAVPDIAELTLYYMNLVTLGRLERNPTVKTEIAAKGFGDSLTAGFFCYPVNQAADITIFGTDVVPVGEDQIPMVEQANEIVRRFNRLYNTDCLKEAKAVVGKIGRLPGIDGKAKASKSLGNAILLSDTADDIKAKVFAMYTDPNHLKVSDPGIVDGNVVFTYLDAFYDDKDELENLKEHYKKGGLGDVTIKILLNDTLQKFLEPIREKRAQVTKEYAMDILRDGTYRAKKRATKTISAVRKAIGIQYF